MDAQTFLDGFATVADAPGGIQRLRELVLKLAVRGQLVEQHPSENAAAILIDGIPDRRHALVASGAIRRPRHPAGVAVDDPPHEVPSSWVWARMGDVSAIVGGGTPKSGEPGYWSDGPDVPWLTPADMRSQPSRLVSRGARDITERGLAESSAQLLPAGAVLFSSRAPIGHVGIAAQPLSTNQGFKSCVPYVDAMTEYLYLFLRHVGPIVEAAATGTTFKEVSGKDVALIPVPVPPLAEQARIVTKVDELMGLCDDLEARQERRRRATTHFRASAFHALTEAETPDDLHHAWERVSANWPAAMLRAEDARSLKATVLQLAVEGRLVSRQPPEGTADQTLSAVNDERARLASGGAIARPKAPVEITTDEQPFQLPEHWKWVHVEDVVTHIVDCLHRTPAYVASGVPAIRTSDVEPGRVRLDQALLVDEATYREQTRRLIPREGD